MENDRVRQIIAAVVGIIIIIALILVAKWSGDRIREKFLAPKIPPTVSEPVITVEPVIPVQPTPTVQGTYTTTIPATGPNDIGYIILGFMFMGGSALKLLDRKAQSR